ncbi:D-2-hydroxyacid dehydrogenase [Sutcliffiella halmapala]|uniref:D-2-hydroxyacid dehydrogenase n=1 Tax=Sutcliffiella halmapala TaxID=79882 RepID=UPI000995C01D|nr:D-2-hydroxyacid dehydrogenase [Sutcliffiella halmapala]
MQVVSTFVPTEKELIEDLENTFPTITFSFYEKIDLVPEEEWSEAEIIVTYGEDLTAAHIESALHLKWIMVTSAGMELMPLSAIKQRNILVTNAKGIHKIPMAEYTISMMLQVARNTKILIENEKAGTWNRAVPIAELHGQAIAIIGAGSIGGEIARLAKAFQMKTLGVNRNGGKVTFVDEIYSMNDLDIVLPKADFIVNVLPSTSETKHILQAKHFSLMKKSAVFLNVGRGDVVDETTLIHALENGEIAHVVLDVFEQEPLQDRHVFWKMPNVTVTPHLSSRTKYYQPRALKIFKHNLHVYLEKENEFQNIINVERGY